MSSILFVHGTGVRKDDFDKTFKTIKKAVHSNMPGWHLEGCYWGLHGVKLNQDGASIPDFATSRDIGDEYGNQDYELLRWQILYNDPLYELSVIAEMSGNQENDSGPDFDFSSTPQPSLYDEIIGFRRSERLTALIEESDLTDVWFSAFRTVTESGTFTSAVDSQIVDRCEIIEAFARAVVAQAIVLVDAQGVPVPDGAARDGLAGRMIEEFHCVSRGGLGSIARHVSGLIERALANTSLYGFGMGYFLLRGAATYTAVRKRGLLSDSAAPLVGDILFYQTRGDRIRECIRESIDKTSGSVVLLAHSLGGIACVDILNEAPPDKVKGLITVGSQAPALYELDCLTSLPHPEPLHKDFPPWLNIYDPQDFLSFVGRNVFGPKVEDFEVKSSQPFPKSHKSYWKLQKTWDKVADFSQQCLK